MVNVSSSKTTWQLFGRVRFCFTTVVDEPFYGTDDQELIRANKAIKYEFHQPEWAEVSSLAQDWIYHTLAGPEMRVSPIEARQHPWLADAVRKEDERKAGSFSASVSHGSQDLVV